MSLPWTEVNAEPAMAVAEVIGLIHSKEAGAERPERRKWQCPVCGGRDALHAGDYVFHCYGGCGRKSYSNVDLAMVAWGKDAADAVKELARALNIPVPDDPAPFEAVKAHDTGEVARALELAPRGERLWECPACRQTLKQTRRAFRCDTGCGGTWHDAVDLAMRRWSMRPTEACWELARRLGIQAVAPPPAPAVLAQVAEREPRRRESEIAWEEVRSMGGIEPPALYRAILDRLSLAGPGQDELLKRRIAPLPAYSYGYRTLTPLTWAGMQPWLSTLSDAELRAAGIPREERWGKRQPALPWAERHPFLVIPYRTRGGRLFSLRFRCLAGKEEREETGCPKYLSLKDHVPELPFRPEALSAPVVHIIEGELNAEIAANDVYRLSACGRPGAGVWDDDWSTLLSGAERVVYWGDNDRAGLLGSRQIRDSLDRVHGEDWRRPRWRRLLLDRDISDLHQDRRFSAFLAPRPWEKTGAIDESTDPIPPP